MSGGSLNYFYSQLQEHTGDFGDRELDDLVKDLAELFHDREWYLSGDTSLGAWREAKDEFKEKWFTKIGRENRIEKYLNEITNELHDSFGFGHYCRECDYWTPEDDGRYGKCKINPYFLMHRSEICEKIYAEAASLTL